MDLNLTGKVAVVTGASKGIGLAVATALAAEGVLVVAGARNVNALAGITGVHPVAVDLTSADGPASLISEAVATFGGLDILVNNIGGVTPHLGGFVSVTDEDWLHALTINLLTPVRTTRAA